jgi:hypothetical protein
VIVEYVVRRERARRLWVPYDGFVLPPPRLVQLVHIALCVVWGHRWGDWMIDDYDGPGEFVDGDPGAWMPYCARTSRAGEFGIRTCPRCQAIETRWAAADAPPLFKGRRILVSGEPR